MVTLEAVGICTSTYSGDMAIEEPVPEDSAIEDTENVQYYDEEPGNLLCSSSTISLDGKHLLFFYDCETTGWSHHNDHIIEIASSVMVPDNVSVSTTEFSYLCRTSRHIAAIGIYQYTRYMYNPIYPPVSKKCGITAQILFGQPSFSIVFHEFLEWIKQCVQEASSNNDLYYPGMLQMTVNTLSFTFTFQYW